MLGLKLAACMVTLLVSLVLPVALPICLSGRYRGDSTVAFGLLMVMTLMCLYILKKLSVVWKEETIYVQ